MKPATTTPPPRKATPSELGSAALLLVAMLVLTATLVRNRLAQRPAKTDDPLGGTVIVPSVAQEGVVVTPGPGRLLFVDTTPSGAELLLDGTRRGETPFSTDFACQEGQPTALELKKPGFQVAHFALDCVSGSTRVSATLKRTR